MTARIVLVESASHLPGLLPFQAWDAMAAATTVLVRDPGSHPHATHLYYAGIDLEALEPAAATGGRIDLLQPGSPAERRLAQGLVDRGEEEQVVVYLLGPGDDGFGQLVGLEASKRGGLEVEFVFLPPLPRGSELLRLVDVEEQLRDPDGGCPWDLEQDHRSLTRYLLEEAYEVLEAIEDGTDDDLEEELGDLLLQVVFHAQIATDRGAFTIDDVAHGIAEKLVRRHPHVFADVEVADADEVKANWETLKQEEKGRTGPFEGVPTALPALMLAWELQRAASKLGFDWRDASTGPADKVSEELREVLDATGPEQQDAEVGDLLHAVVSLARHLDVEPEGALRRAAGRFRDRFERALELARQDGSGPGELDTDAWLELWERARARD